MRRPTVALLKHLGDSLKALLDIENDYQALAKSLESVQKTRAQEREVSRRQVEELVSLVELIGESKRWRIGDFIVSSLRKIMGRPHDSAVVERARDIADRR